MQIRSVQIRTSQVETLKKFYQSTLKLDVESTGSASISIKIGSSILNIDETQDDDPFYHFAINIPSNKIEEARNFLESKVELLWLEDYKSVIADFVNWNAKSIYFFDPVGNIVELIARLDLQNATPKTFSSGEFLSISEIGFVFRESEIEEQTRAILKQTGLTYFLKQRPMEHFKVLGDDEGLFIIVAENRNWYPTNKPSAIFPLEVMVETLSDQGQLIVRSQ
jgi:hypothetical protein